MKTTKMSKHKIYSKIERRTKRTKHTKNERKVKEPGAISKLLYFVVSCKIRTG